VSDTAYTCDGCGIEFEYAPREVCVGCLGETPRRVTELEAALAALIASIHVATQRGWHHMQIAHVQEAADEAQAHLPPLSTGE